MTTINLVKYHSDYLIPKDGLYLVKTVDVETGAIDFQCVTCFKHFNQRINKFHTKIHEETIKHNYVLEISEQPLKLI